MTRFYLDSREIAPPPTASSIGEILNYVEESCLAPGMVIRQIEIDGRPLVQVPVEQSGWLDSISQRNDVEIFTGCLKEIACESTREALECLDRIEAVIPSLTIAFRICPGQEASRDLTQLHEGLHWLALLLDKLKKSFTDCFEKAPILGTTVANQYRNLLFAANRLQESQKQGNFIEIPELLEDNVAPLLPVWRETFQALSVGVAAAP